MLVEPPFAFAKEAITRKNTKIGATALRAPTNKSPKSAITVNCGTVSPRMIPTIKPTMIRFTRLMLFHFEIKFFMCHFRRNKKFLLPLFLYRFFNSPTHYVPI